MFVNPGDACTTEHFPLEHSAGGCSPVAYGHRFLAFDLSVHFQPNVSRLTNSKFLYFLHSSYGDIGDRQRDNFDLFKLLPFFLLGLFLKKKRKEISCSYFPSEHLE